MSSERHLHPVAMIIGAVSTLRRWIGSLVFPGIVLLMSQGFSLRTVALFLLAVIVVAALAAIWGFLSWRATTYVVTGNSFRLKRGVFQKSERTIPLDHVQSVDTVQGVIQRAFGVYEVRIETAGGGTGEPDASLSALDRTAARSLRREVEGTRRERVEDSGGPAVLRRLSTGDLLIAGATSGQIGVAFSLLAVGSQFFDDFLSDAFVRRLIETLAPNWLMVLLIFVPVGLLLAWFLAIAGTVLAYADFTLSREGDFLYIKRGLLERREATVPLARIQAIKVVEGVLRQPFGFATLRVESAGFGTEEGVSTALFPLLPRGEIGELLRAAVPEFVAPLDQLEPLPVRARRRYAFRAALPALALAVPFAVLFFPWGMAALLLVALAALYGLLRHRAAGHTLGGERLVLRFRRLARTTVVVPRGRLQSRGYSVSPLQRRLRLATLKVEVASGSGGAAFRLVDMEAVSVVDLAE